MFTVNEWVALVLGAIYGFVVLGLMYSWSILSSWDFIKHDNTRGKHGTDTVEIKRVSAWRALLIGVASLVWPLTLAFMILYGILRLPVVLYRKSAS